MTQLGACDDRVVCKGVPAKALDKVVSLVDLDEYITEEEKNTYVKLFLDSGSIGIEERNNAQIIQTTQIYNKEESRFFIV